MSHLEDILSRLGWDDGFQIPIANAENKELEEELAKLSLRKTRAKNALDRSSGKLEALKEHNKFVNQENEQSQKLITAQKQQYDCVEHQFHVSKAEKDSAEREIKKNFKDIKEIEEFQIVKKNDLQKSMAKAEQLKTETDWDSEALKAWEEALKKRGDDNELIKKFFKEDERKYNELEAKRQLLQSECARRRNAVSKMISDLNNSEMVIQRSGKIIKQQVNERDALVNQWKDSVKMLQQRDGDIVRAQATIVNCLERIERNEEKLEEEMDFLRNEKRNNLELKTKIDNTNVDLSNLRKDLSRLDRDTLLLSGEINTLKREVALAASQLENERIRKKRIVQDIKNKGTLGAKFREEVESLQKKQSDILNSNMSAVERVKKIEKLIETEEKLYNVFLLDTERINGNFYRTDRQLKEQKDAGKNLEIGINNTTCHINQLRKHIRTESKNLERIKEVVYDMQFRIDDFEQRLCKLEGDTKHDNFSHEIEKKIQELEQVLADHKDVQHTLQTQVDRLQEEMRRLANLIALDKEQYAILQNKCENYMMVFEIGNKHIAVAKQATQEKQVEENMVKLRINQIEKDMKTEDKQIYSMEKLRLSLDHAMKERQIQIDTHKAIVQAKRRNLEEDRGRLRADINLRKLKIEQIQKKYHIVLMSLGKDEDGQPFSVAAMKIKYNQEKFALQQEGDELDQKIKTAEKEIVAMENTLKLVNLTNSAFRNSLAPVKSNDVEVKEMKFLEEQLKKDNLILRERRRMVSAKKETIQDLNSKMDEIKEIISEKKSVVSEIEENYRSMEKQEYEKAEKLKRVECLLKRVLKKLGKKNISSYDRDFEIRQIKDANKAILQRLVDISNNKQQMAPLINRYVAEHGVLLPETRLSVSSISSLGSVPFSRSNLSMSHYENSSRAATNTSRSLASESSAVFKIDLSFNL